ncbi:MAG: gliding motility protein GldN [Muribaculaceae bacterium]|nr:gliding motility protein GldN [Bacteroidales bacterium]MDY2732966.1 gliding motility protein GldN [Muribaculaceae bacterium]
MKLFRKVFLLATVAACAVAGVAQVENAGGVRKRSERDKKSTPREGEVSQRMQDFYTAKEPHDADISYMREIYRQLDLNVPDNTPLYYPEDVVDGQKNLFRLILGLVVDGKIPAYEYLDGREAFTDQYKVKVAEMLDRFGIYYTHGKGGTERNPKFVIEEADVPTGQVLTYYIIEKWEFDRRSNRMKTRVEAICPVLNRMGDFGGEAKYPMFWVKYDQLRPYLAQQYVFLTDDNNLPQYSLDDYFNLGMYKGDIYKTRNLRNLSMVQMYPDPDDLARAQDSIDRRLREYGKDLWVPTREEYLAQKEKEEAIAKAIADGDTIPGRTVVEDKSVTETKKARKTTRKRSSKKAKVSSSAPKSSAPNSNATKSVRRRKK